MTEHLDKGDSLQRRILLMFLPLGLLLVIATSAILWISVYPTFEAFEQQQSLENLARLDRLVQAHVKELNIFNREYSAWDETYRVMDNQALLPAYIEDNMDDKEYMSEVGIETILIFDTNRQLAWGEMRDPLSGALLPFEEEFLSTIGTEYPIVFHDTVTSSASGWINTPWGILLVSSFPILRAVDEGMVMGSFVAGRFITAQRLAEMEASAGIALELFPIAQPGLPQRIIQSISELANRQETVLTGTSGTEAYTRNLILDITGRPLAVLETHGDKRISAIGSNTINLALFFVSGAIILFIFTIWFLLRRQIVEPIFSLKQHVNAIRHSGDLSIRFNTDRRDEIGRLALEFDHLTGDLAKAQEQLEMARDVAEASSVAKSEFLANMSHEIRTPMNGVIGMTEVLLRTDLSTRQQHLANTVKSSGKMLLNLINDILDFSKISAGKMQLDTGNFQLRQLISEVNTIMAGPAQLKDIEYLCRIDNALPDNMIADSQRIRQILINLIGNAIKFTEQGEVLLSVQFSGEASQPAASGAVLKFKVTDSGVGIRPEVKANIFESFSQADTSTTREFGGTGLGLAICKQLVDAMGGDIGVTSTQGAGSEFFFTVPVGICDKVVELKPISEGQLKGRKVLVVDDNATNLDILESHLQHWGALCECASSGREALSKLQAKEASGEHFDLLIIDYHMPQMDGRVFANQVFDEKLRYGNPLMVMLSSVSDEFAQIDLQATGISGYLNKPVLHEELYQHLCRAMEGRPSAEVPRAQVEDLDNLCLNRDVLVVEDNPVNQELIAIHLKELGATVAVSDNGEEALKALHIKPFDLIVMDCQMPVMDGFEATRRIRELKVNSKNGSAIPILALTANAQPEDQKRCLAAGMDDYLFKPYEFSDLQSILRGLLPNPEPKMAKLDPTALAQVRELQRDGTANILHRLIDVYLETSPALIEQLAIAVTQKNAKDIRLKSHSLKSSSAGLGATRLASLCLELEQMGSNNDLEQSGSIFKELRMEFSLACNALSQEKASA